MTLIPIRPGRQSSIVRDGRGQDHADTRVDTAKPEPDIVEIALERAG
jgi:hypothetical protein